MQPMCMKNCTGTDVFLMINTVIIQHSVTLSFPYPNPFLLQDGIHIQYTWAASRHHAWFTIWYYHSFKSVTFLCIYTSLICIEIKADGGTLSLSSYFAMAAFKYVCSVVGGWDAFVSALTSNILDFFSKALTLLLKWNLSCTHLFFSLWAPGFSKLWSIFYLMGCECDGSSINGQ